MMDFFFQLLIAASRKKVSGAGGSPFVQQSSFGASGWHKPTINTDGSILIVPNSSTGMASKFTRSGTTWSAGTAINQDSEQMAASDDGVYLLAEHIYALPTKSSNSGSSFANAATNAGASDIVGSVGMSSNGQVMIHVRGITANHYVRVSTNYGVTWGQQTGAGSLKWAKAGISGNGSKILVASNTSGILWGSSNSGASFSQLSPPNAYIRWDPKLSYDGSKILLLGDLNTTPSVKKAYISSNGGTSFSDLGLSHPNADGNWFDGDISDDGTEIIIVGYDYDSGTGYQTNFVLTSTDSGSSFVRQDISMTGAVTLGCCISGDGNYFVVVQNGGYIWIKTTT